MNHKIFCLISSLFLALAIMLARVAPALAAPVILDTTFGPNGTVITNFGSDGLFNPSNIQDIVLQPDGKIIAAGSCSFCNRGDFALARYNTDGSLDTTFDTDGIVTTDFNNNSEVGRAVALQPDGKIVMAGFSTELIIDDKFALARYNSDGSLDTSFDTDGKVITPIGGSDNALAVAVQSDGKILVAGGALIGTNFDFALVRYNSDGSLDTSFDADGIALTGFGTNNGDGAQAMTLQSDGKIILAGSTYNRDTNDLDFALARYNSDGSLDTTFDADGKVITDFGISVIGKALTLQSDGKIVMAGTWSSSDGINADIVLARYNSNGSLDTTFDTDGKVTWDFGGRETGNDVAIGSDGRIVVAGSMSFPSEFILSQFALARYNSNGSPDTTFDTDGIVITSVSGFEDFGEAIAIQTDGKIIVGGSAINNFALARFNVENSSTEVTIDIKPGSQINPINPRSSGKIPVAILSTPDFNAVTEIDKTSLTFGSIGDEYSLASCNKRGTDVNGDGLKDLVCHFKTKLTGFKFGDIEGILKGQTLGDVPIEGRDVVRVLNASYP